MDSSGIPTDGPETVLGQAARRSKLRYSRTYVGRAVASHPQPGSLLALVEVAGDLGIKTTAGKTDAAALAELELPAIVHFEGAEGGGFGLLEAVTPDGFKLWDSVHGLHVVERDVFLKHWSGIVTLFEHDERRGPREKDYLRNRITELLFSGYNPPALVGSRHATALRIAFGVLLTALLVLGISALPGDDRLAASAVTALSLLGFGVTIIASVAIGSQDDSLSDRICKRGKLVDCHSVLSSRYSRIFGIPLTDIGIAFFGSILLLIATGSIADGGGIWPVVGVVFAVSVPFSVALVGVQVAMKQLCTLCLVVHGVNISAAAILWIWLRPAEWAARDILSSAVLLSLYLCLLLFLAIPYFRKHQGMRVLAGMQRRISGSPFASLAELLTEEPTQLIPTDHAVPLEGPVADHTLTVFVHPSCGKCDPVLQQVAALSQSGMVNAFVGLAPKDPEETDRRACSAVVAAGLALGSNRVVEAYAVAKSQLGAMLRDDPIEVLATSMAVPRPSIESILEDATQRTRSAEELVDAHAEGTPAVFFNSRLFRGELGHLVFLLQEHPDLLAPTRLDRAAPQPRVEVSPS